MRRRLGRSCVPRFAWPFLLGSRPARCSPSRRLAPAKEPPNQNDPCSSAGRNTCGTTRRRLLRRPTSTACAGSATTAARCPTSRTRSASTCSTGTRRRTYQLPRVDRRHAEEPRRRDRLAREPPPDGVRDLGVRPERQGEPAGRGDALRPRADGRRARRARSTRTGVSDAVADDLRRRRARLGALPRALPRRRDDRPTGCASGEQGTATIKVLSAIGRAAAERRPHAVGEGHGRSVAGLDRRRRRRQRRVHVATAADGATIAVEDRADRLDAAGRLRADRPRRPRRTGSGSSCPSSQVVTGSARRPPSRRRRASRRSSDPADDDRSATTSRDTGHDRRASSDGFQVDGHRAAVRPVPLDRRRSAATASRRGRAQWQANGPGDLHDTGREAAEARLVRLPAGRARQRRRTTARESNCTDPLERVKVDRAAGSCTRRSATSRSTPGASITDLVVRRRASAARTRPSRPRCTGRSRAATRSTATARPSGRAPSRRTATASTAPGRSR